MPDITKMVGIHILVYQILGRGISEREVIPNLRQISDLSNSTKKLNNHIQHGPEYICFRTPTPEVNMKPRPRPRPSNTKITSSSSDHQLEDHDEIAG